MKYIWFTLNLFPAQTYCWTLVFFLLTIKLPMILNIKWKVLVKRNNAQAQTIVHTHTHKQKMSLAKTYSNRVYIVKRVTSYCIAICNNLLSMWQMMLVNTRFKSRIFNVIARESRCDVFMRSNSTLKTVRQINEMSSRPTNRK